MPLHGFQLRVDSFERSEYLVRAHEFPCTPDLIIVKRHQFHKPNGYRRMPGKFGKKPQLAAVDTSEQQDIELDMERTGLLKRRFKVCQNTWQKVSPRYFIVAFAVERIEAEIYTVKPCLDQTVKIAIEQYPVCGQCNCFDSIQCFCITYKINNIISKQGLTPCKPDLRDTATGKHLQYPANFFVTEFFNGNVMQSMLFAHTVNTTQIAS